MVSFDDLYRPASMKIERAEHHINDLNAQINAFLAEKPFQLIIVTDKHAGQRTHRIESEQPIPARLSLILGDAIHNLRSALDVTLFGMIGAKATKPWMVQFPFSRKKDGLKDAITKAEVTLAGKNVVTEIEMSEPYEGGNVLLHGLNTLDITDKHRLVITTGRNAPLSADDLSKIDPALPISGPGVLKFSGDALFTVNFPRPSRRERRADKGYTVLREKPDIQPAFEIAFGSGEPFAGQPLVPKLIEIAAEVKDLSRRLCDAFLKP